MKQRVWLILPLFIAACSSGEPGAVRDYRAAARGKNVVLVLLDAAALRHFSYAGYDRATTPNIDALATESLIFDQAYAPAASTPYSVYSLLTSLHSFIAEAAGLRGEREQPFRVTETTQLLPELLAPRFGHRSGISGNSWFGPEFGLDRGFTDFAGAWDTTVVPDTTQDAGGRVLDLVRRDLDRWDAGPNFSYVHFLEPHSPYTPPDPFARMFHPTAKDSIDASSRALMAWRIDPPGPERQEMTRALYDANLAYVDSLVGEFIGALQERGLWDDTIFILTADHGEAFWEHGVWGHGRHIFDEFVHIPMLIRMPGVKGLAGRHVSEVVGLKDLLPTLLDLTGLPIPEVAQGRSLLPLIAGQTAEFEERRVFTRGTHGDAPEFGVRFGDFKWIYRVYEGSYQLYNLKEDPDERHDLAASGAVAPELDAVRKEIALWIAEGTGRIEPVEKLDAQTEARLKAIGYF